MGHSRLGSFQDRPCVRLSCSAMDTTPRCFACNTPAPENSSDYTLIGSKGWRLARRPLPDGTVSIEWRCPSCWVTYKERTGFQSGMMPQVTVPIAPSAGEPIAKKPK
jgi:hypothetical protein